MAQTGGRSRPERVADNACKGQGQALLARDEAIAIINHQVIAIEHAWQAVCDEASLSDVDRTLFWRRQFLNPFAFLNAPAGVRIPLTG